MYYLNLIRSFLTSRSTERAFYLAGIGDTLIVLTVIVAVVAGVAKLVK